jgi:predicted GNAT family N-acyltransferase
MDIHVVPVDWSTHQHQLNEVRDAVFVREQGVPQELEWDGLDADATHFLAVNEAGQALGCARLLGTGQIGRMAVVASQRRGGIGRRLLEAAVEKACEDGHAEVFVHAQTEVARFYREAGFVPEGQEFMEADIPHIAMRLILPVEFRPSAEPIPAPLIVPQESDADDARAELKHLHGEPESIDALAACVAEPTRALLIYSQYLDHALFDRPEIVDAVSRFVRSAPPATLRILIHSSQPMVSRGHKLLELARRIDSKIEIRKVPDGLATDVHTYLVWDQRGYWLMPDYREYDGLTNLYDPVQASKLTERFDYLWNLSSPDPELRILRI